MLGSCTPARGKALVSGHGDGRATALIAAILTAVSIVTQILVHLSHRNVRALGYYAEEMFARDPEDDVRFVRLTIRNAGNRPIHRADFEKPIVVHYETDAPVSVFLRSQVPKDLIGLDAITYGEKCSLIEPPPTFNVKDRLEVGLLSKSDLRDVSVSTRIRGETEAGGAKWLRDGMIGPEIAKGWVLHLLRYSVVVVVVHGISGGYWNQSLVPPMLLSFASYPLLWVMYIYTRDVLVPRWRKD